MRHRQCFRCGSTELQAGHVEEDQYSSHIMFRSKSEAILGGEVFLLNAVLCMSCGHTELIADLGVFTPGTKLKCPYCEAIYSYTSEDELSQGVVRCQNCNKEFGQEPIVICPSCKEEYLSKKSIIVDGRFVCQKCETVIEVKDSD